MKNFHSGVCVQSEQTIKDTFEGVKSHFVLGTKDKQR